MLNTLGGGSFRCLKVDIKGTHKIVREESGNSSRTIREEFANNLGKVRELFSAFLSTGFSCPSDGKSKQVCRQKITPCSAHLLLVDIWGSLFSLPQFVSVAPFAGVTYRQRAIVKVQIIANFRIVGVRCTRPVVSTGSEIHEFISRITPHGR